MNNDYRASMRTWRNALVATLIVCAGNGLSGCAVNPVSGHNDFVMMSESQEIAAGRDAHPKIIEQYGLYDNPALQAYVQKLGEGVAANSHRNNLVYRFTVLDSTDVNAFALPGGYVYITRGLLAYINTEAELAAVLGHEIGHVTARHAVRQQSAATVTGLLGSVLAAGVGIQGTQDLVNVLGSALLQGYGREHELEADRLGAEYLARSGYDPHAMIEVIGILKDQEQYEVQQAKEEGREPHVYHGVFASHPDNDKRLQEVVGAANKFKSPNAVRVERDGFLHEIDGLTFGDSERDGIRRGNHFYHAGLGVAVDFPVGWKLDNQPKALLATAPQGAALLQLSTEDLNKRVSPSDFLRERLKITDLRNGEAINDNGMNGYTGITSGKSPFGTRPIRITVLYLNNTAYAFYGATKDARQADAYDRDFLATARSFHAITAQERSLAREEKIRLQRATANTRFEDLARSSPISDHPLDQLRLINGLYPSGEPAPGSWVKVVD
jgi:predicted Zn-dependent protease